jgi:hypothetical protein
MRNWETLSFFIITFFLTIFFVVSCGKKVPEPPKPPQKKVELPPPKPAEPPKKDVIEVKEEIKSEEKGNQIINEKKELPRKPKKPVMMPVPDTKQKKLPQIVNFDKLNREFSSSGLNVWASEIKNNEILLNGYIKSEKERKAALFIARRYNVNITDMINIVEVYSIEEPDSNRVNQPLPFSR